jgi:hypothetical protein
MSFNHLDFLIYSSHKTASQTVLNTIKNHRLNSTHCHSINTLSNKNNHEKMTAEKFIQGLIDYKNKNNKKLKIISIVRNPTTRLISSFFQSGHCDEIMFLNVKPENTTVSVNTEEELCIKFEHLINTKKLHGIKESIDEMSDIFGVNIIQHLKKEKHHYYLNNDLFELYVLDFNKIIGLDNISYLNETLNTNFTVMSNHNLSSNKKYFNKYKNVIKMLGTKLDDIINNKHFNDFYFTLFENNL